MKEVNVRQLGRQVSDFLREVDAERKKIVWPSKNILTSSTTFVVVIIIVLAIYLGIFEALCQLFFRLFG